MTRRWKAPIRACSRTNTQPAAYAEGIATAFLDATWCQKFARGAFVNYLHFDEEDSLEEIKNLKYLYLSFHKP